MHNINLGGSQPVCVMSYPYLVHSVFLRYRIELCKEYVEQRDYRHGWDALAYLDETDHVTEQNRHLIE